jgi:hypothetical protein
LKRLTIDKYCRKEKQMVDGSEASILADHFTDAHLAGFDPIPQRSHSGHDFLMRESGRHFWNGHEQGRRHSISRNGDLFSLSDPAQKLRQMCLGLGCSYRFHPPSHIANFKLISFEAQWFKERGIPRRSSSE